jgi:hypothetical protein
MVKSFLIADQVFQQEGTMKWCIIGTFSAIACRRFPALHPSLGLYLKLADMAGEYRVRVEFQDSNGACLAKLQGVTIEVKDRQSEVGLGLQGHSLVLPKPGMYYLRVFFNDEEAEDQDIRLQVLRMEDDPHAAAD